jgi:hypothetical protein
VAWLDGAVQARKSVAQGGDRTREGSDSQRSVTPNAFTLGAIRMAVKHDKLGPDCSMIQACCDARWNGYGAVSCNPGREASRLPTPPPGEQRMLVGHGSWHHLFPSNLSNLNQTALHPEAYTQTRGIMSALCNHVIERNCVPSRSNRRDTRRSDDPAQGGQSWPNPMSCWSVL